MAHQCDHTIHVLDCEENAALHDLQARECHCGSFVEIVQEDGCETFFIFHSKVRKMDDEAKDLRELLQKCEAEKKELADRISKSVEYLELIKSDREKTNGEATIIETTLSYLRD